MKHLFLLVILGVLLISCGQEEIGLRDEINSEILSGNWLDIGQISPLGQVNSSTKGALISIMQNGTFNSQNENLILGIGASGKWTYDSASKKLIFSNENEIIPGTENYQIEKFWIINSYENNILEVTHCHYRKKSVIVNPLTNEVVGTIDSIDYKVSRRFQKQD